LLHPNPNNAQAHAPDGSEGEAAGHEGRFCRGGLGHPHRAAYPKIAAPPRRLADVYSWLFRPPHQRHHSSLCHTCAMSPAYGEALRRQFINCNSRRRRHCPDQNQ
jgi:hypothetical protein